MCFLRAILIILLGLNGIVHAESTNLYRHVATPEQRQKAIELNKHWHQSQHHLAISASPFRPVEDTANFAYVLMSAYESGADVPVLRKTIAENLPDNVKLVILANNGNEEAVRGKYLKWIPKDRLIIASDEYTGGGFWARDSFPIPVYDDEKNHASLVAAQYFRPFDSWYVIAKSVKANVQVKDFSFVGGNLLADEDGVCFAVDSSRLSGLTEEDLQSAYGCKQVHLMQYLRGIGDVDEVLKPLSGKRMLTTVPEYKADLEAWGYEVIMLPSASGYYRTYANSLIVGDKVFMPTFDVPADAEAQKVYENLGYKVFGIPSQNLSDYQLGSIHCQTMAYPQMDLDKLLKALHVKEYK